MSPSPHAPTTAPYRTLIDAAALAQCLRQPGVRLFDCRHDLSSPDFGPKAYADGHLPGALHLHLDHDLSGAQTGRNGRHPLPQREALIARLSALGVTADTQIIAYDDAFGMFAARLWWLMRWLGHDNVAVLDGGLQGWCEAGQPLTQAVPAFTPAEYRPASMPVSSDLMVDARFVEDHLGHADFLLIDARSPDRFRGENETLDPVGGHIPGATNHFFRDNIDDRGHFKPVPSLRQSFQRVLKGRPAAQVVHQCGSGVTACHNLLAMEHAGLTGARLYPGSWSEWCALPARPVATGPA